MSSRLKEIFDNLPPEGQQRFVEKHLVGLLDSVPKGKSKEVLSAATRLQKKYKEIPTLDLKAKRKQITALLEELARDAKVSFVKERSNRDELLSEILHSLVSWLNRIWSVVYEYNVNFLVAHSCLVFVADALIRLSESSTLGGCKCTVMNLPVEVNLKDKKGRTLKRFSVLGPQNVDRILLWIWRDLFVSLLAEGSERDKKRVPDLLEDIESVMGVHALERLLYGGRPSGDDDLGDNDEDYEDVDDSEDDDDYCQYGDHPCVDEDDDYISDTEADRCSCNFHASYWSEGLNRERLPLRDCVEKRLIAVFKVTPSLRLYKTLVTISLDTMATHKLISLILAEISDNSPDCLVAALDIHTHIGNSAKIFYLLNTYSYLLRPRDSISFQCAVAALDDSPYHSRGLAITEKELNDCLLAIHSSVQTCFSQIEEEANKKDLLEILKLRSSATRQERIQEWAERVATPLNAPMHPMAFAAMMMGLPMLPGSEDDGDDGDILNYVDLDQNDSDLDDLRDEYRPNLKGMFAGWVHLGQTLKGGAVIVTRLYVKAVELMPWLRSADVVAEMENKLKERPNKNHVLDVLTELSSFTKMQRKKLKLAHAEQQRRTANKARSGTTPNQSIGNPTSSSSTPTTQTASPPASGFTFGAPPVRGTAVPLPFPFPPGGMEDVD
ncbi:hypothetical protein GALMADRAFT_250097 [Galerina marginata CBS 339.88]|uniref:Uncharacterized protein n=1 Tax=Galerina marginata (strain CBS 339.88) TaxID=685588 RepID=A0A067T2X6_GALM3|nr:hypothetical protein GALMADRAFT_250097 [Galerina marginata CBS 339.88]